MGRVNGADRRRHARYAVTSLRVDYSDGDTFLFAPIANISAMGIFIHSGSPFPVGTKLQLAFALEGGTERLSLFGVVTWVNAPRPHDETAVPGMGVEFVGLTMSQREAVLELVRQVAYLQ